MRAKIIVATLGLLVLGSAAAYGYVAVTATATVAVSEALFIDSYTITIGQRTGTCSLSQDKSNLSCSIDAFPAETGSLNIQIANRGSAALTITETASSNNPSVTVTVATPSATAPGNGGAFFATSFTVSPSAAPGNITINASFSR